MTLKGPEFKKALLLGLVAAAAPSFFYPNDFGWGNAVSGSARVFLYEFAYYGLMFYLFWNRARRRAPIARVLGAALTGMAFRFAMGMVSAMLLGTLFGLAASTALAAGLFTYLPGAWLHVAVVPFILRSVFARERRRPAPTKPVVIGTGRVDRRTPTGTDTPAWGAASEQAPNYDAAMAHIASYSTVELAVLVDAEGLTVARAGRPGADSDLWAPVVNQLFAAIRHELRRAPDARVQRFDLSLTDQRLVVVHVAPFFLSVLFDNATDELVNVRIAQAVDMVRRYTENKYPKVAPSAATEVAYV